MNDQPAEPARSVNGLRKYMVAASKLKPDGILVSGGFEMYGESMAEVAAKILEHIPAQDEIFVNLSISLIDIDRQNDSGTDRKNDSSKPWSLRQERKNGTHPVDE